MLDPQLHFEHTMCWILNCALYEQCVGSSTTLCTTCWILNCNVLDPRLHFVRASAQYRSSANMISTLTSSKRRSPTTSTSAAANGPLTSFVHRRICSGQCPQCARRLQQTTRKHQTALHKLDRRQRLMSDATGRDPRGSRILSYR